MNIRSLNGDSLRFKIGVLAYLTFLLFSGLILNKADNYNNNGFITLDNSGEIRKSEEREVYISQVLSLGERAKNLEKFLIENGVTDKKAIICLLATAYHESGFNPNVVYREKNGSVSRGVFQFNSRGLGRNVSAKKLHSKEYQVKHLVSMPSFRQWYGEVKSKNWSVQTAMTELTRRIIRCAQRHYAARIKTATKWWQEVKQ